MEWPPCIALRANVLGYQVDLMIIWTVLVDESEFIVQACEKPYNVLC